ncbi:MAG: polymer-forming cytoskeletal protein [Candidatus Korobacteraceae bacterium]|jgi:cytoskeletal protein CcmA (bactofilin family)
MKDSEIIFAVEESPEGGYEAHALGHPIFTQAESLDELRDMVRDAVHCHFDSHMAPAEIRLHFVRSEISQSSETAKIGKSVTIKGELSGGQDLFVDGEIEGSIEIPGRSLTVGPNGRVRANIQAGSVILYGRVQGEIRATNRVDLRKSASLCGNISTARISIEDGAYFKGAIDICSAERAQKVAVESEVSDEVITA